MIDPLSCSRCQEPDRRQGAHDAPSLMGLLRSERNVRSAYKNMSGTNFLPELRWAFAAAYAKLFMA